MPIISDLLISIGGAAGLVLVYEAIRYRKQNSEIKDEAVKQKHIETDAATIQSQLNGIDLGVKYQEKVLKDEEERDAFIKKLVIPITEKLDKIEDKVDKLDKSVEDINRHQSLIERYLDGPFREWVEAQTVITHLNKESNKVVPKENTIEEQ